MTELKPCPFCGSTDIDPEGVACFKPEYKGGSVGWDKATDDMIVHRPACNSCGATTDGDWNTRAEPAPLPDEVEFSIVRLQKMAVPDACIYGTNPDDHIKTIRDHISAQAQDLKLNLIARDAAFKRVAELEAENKRLRDAVQWQPIETAPKDGTRVLIFVDGYVKIARSLGVVWSVFHCDDEFYNEEYHLNYPTHWQPLPEPPVYAQEQPKVSDKDVCGAQVSDKVCPDCDGVEWSIDHGIYGKNCNCNGTGKAKL